MKKLIFVFLFAALVLPVFAQDNRPQSERRAEEEASLHDHRSIYYIYTPIEKVYLAGEGYLIQYRTSENTLSYIGIPYDWFRFPASAAELTQLPAGTSWPYMCVFYKDKEFSHVKLYVHRLKSHTTWGVTPMGVNLHRFFSEDPKVFDFKY
jgi:hypothetical protein